MSMRSSNARPLAPAPPPQTGSSQDDNSLPSTVSGNHSTSIKRASTACQSCKQIKRKCDQAQPCSNCRKSNTRCVYNEAEDGRRKAARKRTVESLELKRDALDSILESLRTSADQQVQKLIDLVRSEASLEDIIQHATAHADNFNGNQLRTIATVINGRPRRTVLSVNDLCDTPLVKVPSTPWTAVINDDEFVSHLMSIYFTWFHVAYPLVDKQLFLQDMQAANPDSMFCTSLLVNAMLCVACHFSDHPRVHKIPSDTNTRGRHFLEEATRLWNEQEGRLSLPNIQAVAIMAVCCTLVGKDRLSWSYVQQMNHMQQELSFKMSQAESRGLQHFSPQIKHSQILVAWTAFLLTVGFGGAFMRSMTAISPMDEISTDHPSLESSLRWFPYPQQTPEVVFPMNELYRAQCNLHQIGSEIQRIHFGGKPITNSWEEVLSLDQKLQSWRYALPHSLILGSDSSTIKPPVMDMHLTFHWFRLTLFNFIKTPESESAESLGQVESMRSHATSQIIESAQSIAYICNRYARDFGLKQSTMWMPQTAISAAHSIIDMLSDLNQSPVIQDAFHELCLVLVAASQRWLVMKGHVRMLFVTAEEKGQKIPKKTNDLLKIFALDRWGEKDHLQFMSASYPNYALAKVEDPRLAEMGDLLEKWSTFQVRQEAEGEAEAVDTTEDSTRASGKSPAVVSDNGSASANPSNASRRPSTENVQ